MHKLHNIYYSSLNSFINAILYYDPNKGSEHYRIKTCILSCLNQNLEYLSYTTNCILVLTYPDYKRIFFKKRNYYTLFMLGKIK